MTVPDIVYLADAPELIPALAAAFAVEWEPYYGAAGPGDATKILTESCNRDRLPLAVAATVDGEVPAPMADDRLRLVLGPASRERC